MDEKLFSARMAEYKSAVDKYLDACLEETQCVCFFLLFDSLFFCLTACDMWLPEDRRHSGSIYGTDRCRR